MWVMAAPTTPPCSLVLDRVRSGFSVLVARGGSGMIAGGHNNRPLTTSVLSPARWHLRATHENEAFLADSSIYEIATDVAYSQG